MTVTKEQVLESLSKVIDPEVGMDVVSLDMIDELFCINNSVHVKFSPTSRHCPIALNIGLAMKRNIESIEGVSKVEVIIDNFINSEEVNQLIKES